ncbi:hypothetical protein V493_04288 [Pseudogymnoascus sp. VKM F-4281 (FW-2241)]|nr:hypothetical protein V493_04288 [Pseudogymnoascus sp. VKM F-4281 (FW-2241)]
MSIQTPNPQFTEDDVHKSQDTSKKEMWSSMLDSVASGKRLPERNVFVLGGSSDSQKEFLEALSSESSTKRSQGRHGNRKPPVANDFALGYTYHDVLDADHEDTIARLSLHLLADSSPTFTPLLRSLLTPESIPNTLIVILLDWSEPWLWLQQLKDWVKLLRVLLVSLSPECKAKMEEVMIRWRDRGRGTALDGGGSLSSESEVSLPLGPGEWEDALGLPLCVVCQNSDGMETLERESAWKEEEFDFVLQTLRTVLLKHGASLIYTIPSATSQLRPLIHSSLGIQPLLKKQTLKHNVIDRDKVVVPPNWDSWGKIRVLRDGFDVERMSQGWTSDIEEDSVSRTSGEHLSAISAYEDAIRDPRGDSTSNMHVNSTGQKMEIKSQETQAFLAAQLEALDHIRNTAEPERERSTRQKFFADEAIVPVESHIGPVQCNMGGIEVDVDDMLKRLTDHNRSLDTETPSMSTPDGKSQNEALASFFAGLVKRGGGSAANSPKPGGI